MTRPRAAVVVTGTELVRGERNDRNGPFIARELHERGVEPASIRIVGDRPDDLSAALEEALGFELCVVSGGLGPTHDDRTVELVARAAGGRLVVDEGLREEIETVSRRIAERLRRPYAEFEGGVVKQASLPEGALSLGLAGTAPGIVLETRRGVVVCLPGPPGELQRLWARAVEAEPVRRVLERAAAPERRVLRLFGVSESAVARALEEAGGEEPGVEATICARDFEIHVDLVAEAGSGAAADALATRLREPLERYLFAEDERPAEAIVLDLCRERGLTLATAESITGGGIGARLTSVPGSSDVFLGGVVAYSNDVKRELLGVPAETLEGHGAVSAETAAAMAEGVRKALGADVAVSVTGVAGPGGGSEEKPVGLVYFHAAGPDGSIAAEFSVPADRATIRARASVTALHTLRRLLLQSRHRH